MAIPVLILGESGSGKSYSIKEMNPDEVGVFAVEKARLPFKKQFKVCRDATYKKIVSALSDPKLKRYVIDDSQYLMVNEFFDRARETGYQKFTDLALNFRNLVQFVVKQAPDDVTVYFLHHIETDDQTGRIKAKTVGKMIDQYLTLEGMFDIVLRTEIDDGAYYFRTQSDGLDTVKSPEEMFEKRIPNDLNLVDKTIREYYGIEEKKGEDQYGE